MEKIGLKWEHIQIRTFAFIMNNNGKKLEWNGNVMWKLPKSNWCMKENKKKEKLEFNTPLFAT